MSFKWNAETLAQQQWYTQGIPGKPVYLVEVSGLNPMHESLGFSYEAIMGVFKEDYCEWNYLVSDLETHARILFERLKMDSTYLEVLRKKYEQENAAHEPIFSKAEGNLSHYSEEELLQLLHAFGIARGYNVGTAHFIESFSLALEHTIRHRLKESSSGKKLNQDYSVITAPTTQSFLSKKEQLLWEIKHAHGEEKQEKVKQFLSQFYWLNSGYTGSTPFTVQAVLNASMEVSAPSELRVDEINSQKEALFEEYHFSEEEMHLIRMIEFVTDWQDERKAKILRGIYGLQRMLNEVSTRFGIPLITLEYFATHEISLELLRSGKMESITLQRRKGCIGVEQRPTPMVLEHEEYSLFQKMHAKTYEEIEILCGTCASMGSASGTVRVLTTLDSISKMQEGEILVAPMTRPEYVPAMKKAAAIITDEGGITSHASIVSREMGKPCIIGTKNATKVLRDGDFVEVKASHGQIIVLRKKGK